MITKLWQSEQIGARKVARRAGRQARKIAADTGVERRGPGAVATSHRKRSSLMCWSSWTLLGLGRVPARSRGSCHSSEQKKAAHDKQPGQPLSR